MKFVINIIQNFKKKNNEDAQNFKANFIKKYKKVQPFEEETKLLEGDDVENRIEEIKDKL